MNRRQLIARALAFSSAAALSGLLSACGSKNTRSPSLVGRPIPPNPQVSGGYAANTSVRLPTPAPVPTSPTLVLPSGVIPRSQWATYGPNIRLADPMVRVERITVHHDGMPPKALRTQYAIASRIEQIRVGHRSNGWADIGYHYIVDPQGRIWEGRPITLQGAHVKVANPRNMGILVLGNFEVERPSGQATSALERFLVEQMHRHRVPVSAVYTHRELAPTACPGRNLQQIMVGTRSRGGTVANA